MDMDASTSRDSREATAQAVRVGNAHQVPTADIAKGQGSELLGPPAASN